MENELTPLGNTRTDENFFEGLCPAIRESDGLDCMFEAGHAPRKHIHEYVRWSDDECTPESKKELEDLGLLVSQF